MSGLLIVGAGGHGKVIADSAFELGRWERIAFLDDKYPALRRVLEWTVLGNMKGAERFVNQFQEASVAIGENLLRMKIFNRLAEDGFEMPVIIHPRAAVSKRAVMERGSFVMSQAAVNVSAHVGTGCIVNTGATVGHDSILGNFVHVAPGSNIGGKTVIGAGSWIGIRSVIIEGIKVGKGVLIGAGAVIIRDVPDYSLVVGNPGRIIKILRPNSDFL